MGQPQVKERKIPMRQCMGCNEHKPKKELIRVVRQPDGTVTLDRTGKLNGRGAYLCDNASCLKKVRKSGRLARALDVTLSDEIYDRLEQELQHDAT